MGPGGSKCVQLGYCPRRAYTVRIVPKSASVAMLQSGVADHCGPEGQPGFGFLGFRIQKVRL